MTQPLTPLDYNQPDRLLTLVDEALDHAERQGASAAATSIGANEGLSVSVRMGSVETIEHHRSKQLGISVYFGQKTGSATTTDLDVPAVRNAVEAACRIACYTQDDEYAGLADADRMATEQPDLDLYHPWELTPEEATTIALEIENAARQHDSRITNSDGAGVNCFQGCHVYGNSHGFRGSYAGTRHSASCAVIAEADGEMQRDYWHSVARRAEGLEASADIGVEAASRTIKRLGARRLSTRTVPVMFSPETARRLFGSLLSAINGASLYRKASFLLDSLGEQIFSDIVSIRDEPHIKGGLGSSSFDYEGVATEPRDLVRDGVLQSYVLDSYAGRRLGMPSTGHAGGVHNLIVEPGELSFDELLRTMDTGLLITELMGMGVNILTGDYSRGVAGFWVENGELQYPVEEITAASNLRDMFLGVRAIGNDVDYRSSLKTGSLLLEKMTIAGE